MESVRNPYIYRIYQLCTNICILTFIHSVCYSYIVLLALADLSQCNKSHPEVDSIFISHYQ